MNLNPEDLIIEISGEGCVKPKECYCCKKFGYHRAKIIHKPTNVSAECVQKINEIFHHEYTIDECIKLLEDPKAIALKELELRLGDEFQKILEEKIPDDAANSMRAKIFLALEIVERFHGKDSANNALKEWVYEYINKKPLDIQEKTIFWYEESIPLKNLLKECGLSVSTSDALRMIKQKSVKVDDVIVEEDLLIARDGKSRIYQIGKKKFMKVKVFESKGYA